MREAVAAGGGAAAIGSRIAADSYGGRVIAEAVEDVTGNKTRFVWLAKGTIDGDWIDALGGHARPASSSAASTTPRPARWSASSPSWPYRSVNMTKIESRPERTTLGHYLFFVDLDGSPTTARSLRRSPRFARKVRELRVLGSFPVAEH